ncbi:MAG: TolC family protein [Planctomycetota bacterium]|jgi:outer membrane protein TolC
MRKTWIALASAALLAGCFASPSPVARRYPYLRPGARIEPGAVGVAKDMPDLPLKGTLGLATVLKVAFDRNPAIARARAQWAVASATIAQAGSLPDPMIRITQLEEPVQTRAGAQRQRVMVMQKIPFPLTLTTRSAVAREKAAAAWVRYDKVVRDVVARIKNAYFEVHYLRRALDVVGEAQKLAEELAGLAEAARGRDESTLFDAVKAKGQTAQLLYDRIVLEELLAVETARLNGLLDRPAEAPLGGLVMAPFRPFDTSLEALYRIALDRAQELKLADREIRIREKQVNLSAYRNLPNFEVGWAHNVTDPYPGMAGTGTDSWGVFLGMNLPLWFNRNAARIREAERRLDAAFHGKRETIQSVLLRVKTAYFRLNATERLVLLYSGTLLPQAEDAMAKAETWFRSEAKNFSKFLEAQAVLVNFQLAHLRAGVDYRQALARLEQATGGRTALGAGGD